MAHSAGLLQQNPQEEAWNPFVLKMGVGYYSL
jgi:hypothetical protein